jgi:hypothetical protein
MNVILSVSAIRDLEQKTKMAIAAVIFAICLTISAFIDVRYIADGSGVTLYWKGSEAYIFTSQTHTGYHISYLDLPVVILLQFYWVPAPSDERECPLAIHVTPTDVERQGGTCGGQEVRGNMVTPYDNHFYALCQSALLCKWTIDGYVIATPDETRRLDPGSLPALAREDGQVISGSTLHYSPYAGSRYEIPLSDGSVISVINRQKRAHSFPLIAVALVRPGQKPQSLYYADGTPHKSSEQEYIDTFPNH